MFWADGMKIGAMVMVLDGRRRAVVPLRSVAVAPRAAAWTAPKSAAYPAGPWNVHESMALA